ncbi:hypothetical protein A4A49_53617, partial [Nicotiana attenuata]
LILAKRPRKVCLINSKQLDFITSTCIEVLLWPAMWESNVDRLSSKKNRNLSFCFRTMTV